MLLSRVFDILIFDILPENSKFNFQAVPPPPDPSSGLIPFHLCGDPRAINTKQRKLESEVKVQNHTYQQNIYFTLTLKIRVVVQKFYFSGKKTYIVGGLHHQHHTKVKYLIMIATWKVLLSFLINLQIHSTFSFSDWSGVRDG